MENSVDINVKEIELLRVYSSKLRDFRNWNVGRAILIDRQLRKIREDYDEILKESERYQRLGEDANRYLQSRYDNAISEFGEECRTYVGSSDREMNSKCELLNERVDRLRQTIQTLQVKLENAGQKTKNFSLQALTNVDSSCQYIEGIVQALEDAKNIKK